MKFGISVLRMNLEENCMGGFKDDMRLFKREQQSSLALLLMLNLLLSHYLTGRTMHTGELNCFIVYLCGRDSLIHIRNPQDASS